MPNVPASRYHAFLCFAPEDNQGPRRAWADWVTETLEGFAVPRSLAGRPTPFGPVPQRLTPIFKPVRVSSAPLAPQARQALEQSRMLIVICSPAAAASEAVAEEIRYFKQLGRDRILALIVRGEPDAEDPRAECFPETLKYEVKRDGSLDREWRLHPVSVDARADRSAPGTEGDAVADARRLLLAAALGVLPEALARLPEARQGTGDRRGGSSGVWVAGAALLAAGGLGWFAYQAQQEKQQAEASRRRSDELIVFLQRSLRGKLAPIGQLPLLADVNERIGEHLGRVARETKDPVALAGLADTFRDSAEILLQRGNHAAALEPALEAARTRQRLAENGEAAAETPLHLIQDQELVVRVLLLLGQAKEALAAAEKNRALAIALSRKRLGDDDAEHALAKAHRAIGDAQLELGKLEEAGSAYQLGRDAARQLATRAPRVAPFQAELAAASERLGKLKERQGDLPSALIEYSECQRLTAQRAAASPADATAQAELAAAIMRTANLFAFQRQVPRAAAEFRKAAEVTERISRLQPADRGAQMNLIIVWRRLGETLAQDPAGQTDALAAFQRALDLLGEHFPGDADVQASTARADIERMRAALMTTRPN